MTSHSTFTDETVTVVIGGTSGIGKAVAQRLAERPGRVVGASRSTGLDVADPKAVAAFLDELGPVDHVIFTAGSKAPGGPLSLLNLTDAREAFEVKFWGAITVAQAAAPHIRPGGTLTLTSGNLARKPTPGALVKTAMNAATEASAKVLAREFAPIRVNVVSPGLTDTEAHAGMAPDAKEAMLRDNAARLPAGRVAEAGDVAAGYLFVIDTPSVTGAVIDIDGGALIS